MIARFPVRVWWLVAVLPSVSLAACQPGWAKRVSEATRPASPTPPASENALPDSSCFTWAPPPLDEVAPVGADVRVRVWSDAERSVRPPDEGVVIAHGVDSMAIMRTDSTVMRVPASAIVSVDRSVPLRVDGRAFRGVRAGMVVGLAVGLVAGWQGREHGLFSPAMPVAAGGAAGMIAGAVAGGVVAGAMPGRTWRPVWGAAASARARAERRDRGLCGASTGRL